MQMTFFWGGGLQHNDQIKFMHKPLLIQASNVSYAVQIPRDVKLPRIFPSKCTYYCTILRIDMSSHI